MKTWAFSFAKCKELDRRSVGQGLSEVQLMGQAALASYFQLQLDGYLPTSSPLWCLCGPGNNGGDALALAWYLLTQSPLLENPTLQIRVFLPAQGPQTPTSLFYHQLLISQGLVSQTLEDFLHSEIPSGTLLIDGLLGVGAQGPLREPYSSLCHKVATWRSMPTQQVKLISLDVPSGLTEDSPPPTHMILPDLVYSFGVHKLSLALWPQFPSSQVRLLPMGFTGQLMGQLACAPLDSDPSTGSAPLPAPLLWRPALDSLLFRKHKTHHKYTAGAGLLVGGSPGMEGALLLSTHSFFAAGGGLIVGLCPHESSRASLLSQEAGGLYRDFLDPTLDLHSSLPQWGAALLGPGLGPCHDPSQSLFLEKLVGLLKDQLTQNPHFSVILDAGFLTHHSSHLSHLRGPQVLLTPHRGELQKLGLTFSGLTKDLTQLREWNKNYLGSWLLVKDSVSILCGPSGECYLWNEWTPHLAVAGSGDVLGGILLAAFSRNAKAPSPQKKTFPEVIQAALGLHLQCSQEETNPTASGLVAGIRKQIGTLPLSVI